MEAVTARDYDALDLLLDSDSEDLLCDEGRHGDENLTPLHSSARAVGLAIASVGEPEVKRQRLALDFAALLEAGYDAVGDLDREAEAAERSLEATIHFLEEAARAENELRTLETSGCPMASLEAAAKREEEAEEAGCEGPPDQVDTYDESGGSEVIQPWLTFDEAELGLGRPIVDIMRAAGFQTPTPVQAHAWPVLTAGRDLIGVAKTGSGKTLAFLLPCFVKLLQEDTRRAEEHGALPVQMQKQAAGWAGYSPQVLVIAPSRELVMQIEAEAGRFTKASGVRTLACYGGGGLRSNQLGRLREYPECVVATLGRLTDFLEQEKQWFSVRAVRFFILDEADHLLGEGLSPQIRSVTTDVETPHRQTMMFSATFDDDVRDLASWILRRPVEIRVGLKDPLRANKDVDQQVLIVKDDLDKQGAFKNVLRTHFSAIDPGKVLVFADEHHSCEAAKKKLEEALMRGVRTLHSHKNQRDREKAISEFRAGDATVLIATSLAGRGLDIKDVKLVVNLDAPADALDYVHRIGRTGRAGTKGAAVTLLRKGPDGRAMAYIAQVMRRTGKVVPQELIEALKQRRGRDREFAAALLEGLCKFEHIDRSWAPSFGQQR